MLYPVHIIYLDIFSTNENLIIRVPLQKYNDIYFHSKFNLVDG